MVPVRMACILNMVSQTNTPTSHSIRNIIKIPESNTPNNIIYHAHSSTVYLMHAINKFAQWAAMLLCGLLTMWRHSQEDALLPLCSFVGCASVIRRQASPIGSYNVDGWQSGSYLGPYMALHESALWNVTIVVFLHICMLNILPFVKTVPM